MQTITISLGLFSLLFVLSIVLSIVSVIGPTTRDRSAPALPIPNSLASFEDQPPQIIESLKAGREIWQLDGWNIAGADERPFTRTSAQRSATYGVLNGRTLEYILSKTHADKGTLAAASYFQNITYIPDAPEVNFFGEKFPLGHSIISQDANSKLEINLEGGHTGDEEILLRYSLTCNFFDISFDHSGIPFTSTLVGTLRISHDHGANRGTWDWSGRDTSKWGGTLRLPDKVSDQPFHGLAHRVTE